MVGELGRKNSSGLELERDSVEWAAFQAEYAALHPPSDLSEFAPLLPPFRLSSAGSLTETLQSPSFEPAALSDVPGLAPAVLPAPSIYPGGEAPHRYDGHEAKRSSQPQSKDDQDYSSDGSPASSWSQSGAWSASECGADSGSRGRPRSRKEAVFRSGRTTRQTRGGARSAADIPGRAETAVGRLTRVEFLQMIQGLEEEEANKLRKLRRTQRNAQSQRESRRLKAEFKSWVSSDSNSNRSIKMSDAEGPWLSSIAEDTVRDRDRSIT